MECVIYELLTESLKESDERVVNTLEGYEKVLDPDDTKTDALTEVEMIYFRLGMKAGMGLIKELSK